MDTFKLEMINFSLICGKKVQIFLRCPTPFGKKSPLLPTLAPFSRPPKAGYGTENMKYVCLDNYVFRNNCAQSHESKAQ